MREFQKERWKDVLGYEELYMISDIGRVKSMSGKPSGRKRTNKREIIMKLHKRVGYPFASLRDRHGNAKSKYVHTLVLEAFVCKKPSGKECRHLDGTRSNNHLDNLKWGTHKENAKDSIEHGAFKPICGEKNNLAKLKAEDIQLIRSLYDEGESQTKISKAFSVTQSAISRIVTKDTWKHIY